MENLEAKERAWKAFGDATPGTIILWPAFDDVTRYSHLTKPHIYGWFIAEMMRKRQVLVVVLPSVGLLVCDARQQATIPVERRVSRASRQMKRVLQETETVDRSKLELGERRLLESEIEQARKLEDRLTVIKRAHDQATRPTKALPLPSPPEDA